MACELGVLRVVSQSGGTRGRDYCILYNPQWAHLPHDLSKVVSCPLEATCACGLLPTPVPAARLLPLTWESLADAIPLAWVFMLRSKS